MPKRCSICVHKKRKEIESAILEGTPLRSVAKRFGVSADALGRHKRGGHLIVALVKASEVREVSMAGSLLEQLKSLQSKALSLLAQAEDAGDYRGALAGVVTARGILETLVDIMDRLRENPPIEQRFIGFDSGQLRGALEALLATKAVTIEGEPGLADKREQALAIEADHRVSTVGVRCDEPQTQIG